MNEQAATPQTLSDLDRPNSYIGKSVPRPNLDRLLQGRGHYVSDMDLPRMAHVVFVRSRMRMRGLSRSTPHGEENARASSRSSPARNSPPSSRRGSACSRI